MGINSLIYHYYSNCIQCKRRKTRSYPEALLKKIIILYILYIYHICIYIYIYIYIYIII